MHVARRRARERPSLRDDSEAAAARGFLHLDAGGEADRELLHVGDDPDHPLVAAEALDRSDHDLERLWVERSEALIEEQALEPGAFAHRERLHLVREGE